MLEPTQVRKRLELVLQAFLVVQRVLLGVASRDRRRLSSLDVMNVSVILGTYASSMDGVSPLRYGTSSLSSGPQRQQVIHGGDAHCHDCNEVRVNSATALIQVW